MKKTIVIIALLVSTLGLTACSQEADTVNHNLDKDADNFKIERRIVFLNGITDKYLLVIEGRCSINAKNSRKLNVTCKVAPGNGTSSYKRHTLGLSDNVTYFSEQTKAQHVDAYRSKITFRPEAIVPDIDLRTSKGND